MNKYLYFIVAIPFIFFGYLSCIGQYTKWECDITISNIQFEKVRYKMDNQDTILMIGYLKSGTTIDGYPCSADMVYFTKNFKLQYFKLSENYILDKNIIEKDTWVSLERNGYIVCYLPKEKAFQGFLCMPGKERGDVSVSFDTKGNLRSFFSTYDIKIEKVFCSGGKSNEIGLFKNGDLNYCTMSIDQNFNDVKYDEGKIIYFDQNGNVSIVKEKK